MSGEWFDVNTEGAPEGCLVWGYLPACDQVRIVGYVDRFRARRWFDAYGNWYAYEEVTHWRFLTYPPTP